MLEVGEGGSIILVAKMMEIGFNFIFLWHQIINIKSIFLSLGNPFHFLQIRLHTFKYLHHLANIHPLLLFQLKTIWCHQSAYFLNNSKPFPPSAVYEDLKWSTHPILYQTIPHDLFKIEKWSLLMNHLINNHPYWPVIYLFPFSAILITFYALKRRIR